MPESDYPVINTTHDCFERCPGLVETIEQLHRDLAESRKATESVQAALRDALDGGSLRLLTLYALAVTHMRWLQDDEVTRLLPDWQARVTAAEREVDELTLFHLTPSAHRPGA